MENKSLTTEGKAAEDDQSEVELKPGTLYVAPIENYVDDGELYQQKYNDYSRIKYWEFLLDHPRPPKIPHDHIGWTAQGGNSNFAEEIQNYSRTDKLILATTVHIYWDYIYLYLFGIWILLTTAYFDPLVRLYILIPGYLLYFPLVLMLISQLIPTLGVIYLVTKCNDLTKLVASRTFGYWAFAAVLMGQYIEYTYYAGHRREEKAGKSRLEWYEDWDHLDLDGNPTLIQKSKPGLISKFIKMIRRDSKIVPKSLDSEQMKRYNNNNDNDDNNNNSDNDNDNFNNDENSNQGNNDENENDENDDDDDDDENHVTSGRKHQQNKDGEESVLSGEIPFGLEGGYLQRMKEEAEAAEKAAKQAIIDERLRKEALVTDWHEWKCIVCGKKNRRPRHPIDLSFKPAFSEKGVYLKRVYAKLVPDKDVPSCTHCLTLADYKPRLCTAHVFPHYPKPYEAFENYPEAVPHIPQSRLSTFIDKAASCLFGQRNHPDSRLMVNDWRISIYLSSRFPLVPRPIKPPSEVFEVGEIVECKRQKMDWSRARVVESRLSHIYDIIYDTGDEVRMVGEDELRLPPSKGLYAYRVELCLALLTMLTPLSLMGIFFLKMPGLFMLPTTIICGILLGFRILEFLDSFNEYYAAGCCIIFQQHLLLCYPLLTLLIAGIFGLLYTSLGIPCVAVAVIVILAMFSSLPIIYLKRPTFAVMCCVVFAQISISFILIAIRIDANGHSFIPWVMIDTFPALTSIYTLLRFRRWLGYVWDVSMKIRPMEYADYEVSYPRQLYDFIKENINHLIKKDSPETLDAPLTIDEELGKNEINEQVPSLEMAALAVKKEKESQRESENDIKSDDDDEEYV